MTDRTTEADHQHRQQDQSADSDFLYTNKYIYIQKDLKEIYSSMQAFVISEEFQTHIKRDGYNLDNIEERLRLGKNDVIKTECPIVAAGETCCGKSSTLNLILGEEILPTGITSSTSRVCRVKYCEQVMISTRDSNDEELENMSFENIKEMASKLKFLAETEDPEISYVDIYMPVSLLQGNVIIVDTPGCGDLEQQEAAEMMMSYLPNALAFIFVVNVSNAGGLQQDRLLRVLSNVRDSMDGMVSFSPKDVVFLLNKWDTISHVDVEGQRAFFEKTKTSLRKVWKEVEDSRIFKISASKVSENKPKYTKDFDMFQTALNEIIARNENKRVKVHLRFLNEFLDEFNRVLSIKLLNADQSETENQAKLDEFSSELEKIETTRREEISNIERRIDTFFEKASQQLHEYIHHQTFKEAILANTEKLTRFSIGHVLDTRIEIETKAWQDAHIERIFHETIMGDLLTKFENIQRSLHSIKDNFIGFKTPFVVGNKITTVVVPGLISGGAGLLGLGFLIKREVSDPGVLFGIATAGIVGGIVISSLVAFEAVDDFATVCKNAIQARIKPFTKEKIKCILRERYYDIIQKIIKTFFEGDLEKEIIKIKDNIATMRKEHESFVSQRGTLSSLRSTVIQKIGQLQHLSCIDIKNE